MALVVLLLTFLAQTPSSTDTRAIAAAKAVVVQRLDKALTAEAFEVWLARVTGAGSAAVKWGVTDCGEQTGNPALDAGRDFPMCVEADVPISGSRRLIIELIVGTQAKGAGPAPPEFWSAAILGPGRDAPRFIRTLAEVPAAVGAAGTR
jgi:hypothetical protein